MKIPIIKTEEFQPVTARPEQAGRLWREMGRLGQEGERLVLTVAQQEGELRRKRKALDMALSLGEIEVDIATANEDLITELRRDPDPDTYYSDWDKRFTTIAGRRLAQITDKETRARAEVLVKKIQLQELVEQKHYANQLYTAERLGKAGKVLTGYERAGELKKGLDLIDELRRNGLIAADKAEQLKQSFRDKVKISGIRAVDPEKALRELEAGKWSLSSDDRTALIREIRAEIGYQERQERKRIAEEKEATDKEFFAKLYANKLQPGEVIASNLSRETKQFYMNALAKKTSVTTDGATFHDLFVGVEKGKVESTDLLKAHNADKLSLEHMNQLLTRLYAIRGGKNVESDWWFKILRKEAEQTLNYNGQLERFMHPEGAENFFYGITALMKEIEDRANTEKPLRDRDVYARGKEIFEPFFLDYAVKVLGKTVEMVQLTDGIKTWEMPEYEVEAFLKTHPNARRVESKGVGREF